MDKIFCTTSTKQNNLRSIAMSFFIHSGVILFFVLWNFNKPEIVLENHNPISIELINLETEEIKTPTTQIKTIKTVEPVVENTPKQIVNEPVIEHKMAYQNNDLSTTPIIPIKPEQIEMSKEEKSFTSEPIENINQVKTETVAIKQASETKQHIKQEPIIILEPVIYNASSLNNPAPKYPNISKILKEQGKVILRLLINKNGVISNFSILQSSGYKRLDDSAIETIKKWQFIPAKKGTESIDSFVEIPFIFSLSK